HEFQHQLGKDRDDETHGQPIERHGAEDEGEGAFGMHFLALVSARRLLQYQVIFRTVSRSRMVPQFESAAEARPWRTIFGCGWESTICRAIRSARFARPTGR